MTRSPRLPSSLEKGIAPAGETVEAQIGEVILLGTEELDEVLRQGKVSPIEYDFAWREADSRMLAIEEDMFPLLWLSGMHYNQLMCLPG